MNEVLIVYLVSMLSSTLTLIIVFCSNRYSRDITITVGKLIGSALVSLVPALNTVIAVTGACIVIVGFIASFWDRCLPLRNFLNKEVWTFKKE